jgi:hypothetical protein
MDNEIEHILALIGSARSAWDQYNIQLSLPPADTPRLAQGHPWDAYNNGRRAPQARRDPAAVGAAWNRLQGSLVELSDTANRVRGRLALAPVSAAAPRPDDRRVGAFSRVWSTGETLTQPLRILVPRPLALPCGHLGRSARERGRAACSGSLILSRRIGVPRQIAVSQPLWEDGDQPVEGRCAGRPVQKNGDRLPPPA